MSDANKLAVRLPWQSEQWQRLQQLHLEDKLPHAIMLAGPSGVGKQRFARAFAQYLICERSEQGLACGECRQCGFMLAGSHPDLQWLMPDEPGKQIKIDQVRSLVENLGQTAQQGGYKVSVLAPAEAMNSNAANALLKCLEEPTANTLLILICDSLGQILPTIRSRCQLVRFPVPPRPEVQQWLQNLLPEGMVAETLLLESGGRPLTALTLLENDGVERYRQLGLDYQALLSGRTSALVIADKWLEYDLREVLGWLVDKLTALIRMLMSTHDDSSSGHLQAAEWKEYPELIRCARGASVRNLFELLDKVTSLKNSLDRGTNPNRQLALEDILLTSCEKFKV